MVSADLAVALGARINRLCKNVAISCSWPGNELAGASWPQDTLSVFYSLLLSN